MKIKMQIFDMLKDNLRIYLLELMFSMWPMTLLLLIKFREI
jgi:hypothetical protein